MKPKGKRIIKFSPSFRLACEQNFGWTEEETRQLELEVIKRQAALREGIEGVNHGQS